MKRFAAIDVGSNAVRLMVGRVDEDSAAPAVQKEALLRVPLRLGAEVFQHNRLSQPLQFKLMKTMQSFRHLLDVFEPLSYRACATSAMRDAENGVETVDMISRHCGINLEIIDGSEEALMVFSSQVQDALDPQQSYLFIDVGGGSTELLLYQQGKVVCSRSFNIGTVRILHNAFDAQVWEQLRDWLEQQVRPVNPLAIGSGGNINRLNRIAKKDDKKMISTESLKQVHQQLAELSVDQRMARYGLKPDRADVIVPAGQIYLAVLQWAGIETMHVPKFGLVDGLIRCQYEQWRLRQG
ncbi:MAG: hypothetical protein JXR59_06520 [Desulfuromonadaceae bacterium]|nr:hypothetical protein [Desulfuromonadaceae bacterium]